MASGVRPQGIFNNLMGAAPASDDSIDDDLSPHELAILEDTYKKSSIEIGEEIDVFSRYLDECLIPRGSAAEQRARVFKLLDQYYEYSSDKARVSRERADLEQSARKGGALWHVAHSDDTNNDMDMDDRAAQPSTSRTPAQSVALRWEEEAQTWDLLRRLLPLKYRDKTGVPVSRGRENASRSRKQYWDEFLEAEPKARELKTILEWLQNNANSRPAIENLVKELQRNAERGEILSHGWLHTRGAIKQHKRLVATSDPLSPDDRELANSSLQEPARRVTQLDPDVTLRQKGRHLASQDTYFERAIWLGCFELLRRGRSIADIREWCQERTEAWRAATMSALPLSRTENDDGPVIDPETLRLWRRMCTKLATDPAISDDFERAVYGTLSGDMPSVDKVAKSWDDHMFARYNADLRELFDQYLQRQCHPETQAKPPLGHTSGGIFAITSKVQDPSTPTKSLQAAIIDDKLDAYMFTQGGVLAQQAADSNIAKTIPILDHGGMLNAAFRTADISDSDSLRVLSHILIIISTLDKLDGKQPDGLGAFTKRHQTEEHVIAAYISFLRTSKSEALIPLYASRLSGERCYTTLSRNLIHLEGRDVRSDLLRVMQKLGLDVLKFVRQQPMLYLQEMRAKGDKHAFLQPKFSLLEPGPSHLKYGRILKQGMWGADQIAADEIVLRNKDDEYLIRTIEWLLLVNGLTLETCEYSFEIYKYFLYHQKMSAARVFAQRVPCADILYQKLGLGNPSEEPDPSWWDTTFAQLEGQVDLAPFEEAGVARDELISRARALWEMECFVMSLDCFETAAIMCDALRSDPTRDREVGEAVGENARDLQGFIRPILKEWLLSTLHEDDMIAKIRDMYLPETIIAYVSFLHFAGTTATRDFLLECMDIAPIIAEKESDIAPVIMAAGRMKELVESFASCSKALAIWTSDVKKGPGGSKKHRELGWTRELWAIKPIVKEA